MPRRPRLVVRDVPLHIIQRGNNRQRCFLNDADFLVYLDLLGRGARNAFCQIHAYALMSNHVHVLATPSKPDSAASMMKAVGERYVRYFNERNRRTGTLWDGRFKSCLVQDETYLMVCYQYIELNPVRAGIVNDPLQYPWSSYRANAYGRRDELITPHPLYQALGAEAGSRQQHYRDLVAQGIAAETLTALRDATNHNYACGSVDFIADVELALGLPAERKSPMPSPWD